MDKKVHDKLLVTQKFGYIGTLVYVLLAQTTCVFTSDMYMPGFPSMSTFFAVELETVSVTLFVFFLSYPIGILLFGNLSDKVGRRPVMLASTIVFTLATVACIFVSNFHLFIFLRIIEALGAGACMAVGLALVKDCFAESARESIMLYVVAAFAIGPVLAPLIGGQILIFAPWQTIFAILAGFGALMVVLSFLFKETLNPDRRTQEGVLRGLGRLVVVARNKTFMTFLIVCVIYGYVPFIAYLGVSSFIYINDFGLTAQQYSYFFAGTVAISLLNVIIYKPLVKRVRYKTITTGILVTSLLTGFAIWFIGDFNPFLFNAIIIVYYLSSYLIKPYGVNILLNLQENDTGSASALYNFLGNFIGCFGILYMMMPLGNNFILLGVLTVVCSLISLTAWIYLCKSSISLPGISDQKPLDNTKDPARPKC